jgi:SAM-dependent methyltransferase
MGLRADFDDWGRFTDGKFSAQQWLLARWEVCEGVIWPQGKIDLMLGLIAERLNLGLNDYFVDLGCGGGWMLRDLAPDSGYALGLDFSAAMIGNAVKIGAGDALVQGAIGALPVRTASVDKALCYFVLINMMDDAQVQRSILDMWRIVKPGGRLLIGQLPDAGRSGDYDTAKAGYLEFCRKTYALGTDLRDVSRMPQKLFDVPGLLSFLDGKNIRYQKLPSFNPFYRPGETETVDWRFDLLLLK